MLKYLLLALLIAWLFFASPWSRPRPGNPQAARRPPTPPSPQAMVGCAHCGLHMPADEALAAIGASGSQRDHFCCEDHRKAGPRAR